MPEAPDETAPVDAEAAAADIPDGDTAREADVELADARAGDDTEARHSPQGADCPVETGALGNVAVESPEAAPERDATAQAPLPFDEPSDRPVEAAAGPLADPAEAVVAVEAEVVRAQEPSWGLVPGVGVVFHFDDERQKEALERFVESQRE